MNKSDLIEKIQGNTNLTFNKSEELVEAVFGAIKDALNNGERVEIRGFGAFSIKEYRSYKGRNPKSGEPVTVKAKRLPAWRTGLELNNRINSGF